MKLSYRVDLQVLRGIAVLLVVLYHLEVNGFDNGYLGVDIFFVLSGYLMALICVKDDAVNFYKRRLKRLLPAYFVTVLLTTLTVAFVAVPVDANQRFDNIWFDLIGASNVAFWLNNSYFDSTAFKPLLNLWSLGVELQFYLIAPFLLPFLRTRLYVAIFLIVGSMVAAFIMTTISPKTSFFMMPFRLWEFLLGALAAWYPIKHVGMGRKQVLISILVFLFATIIFLYPLDGKQTSIVYGHPGLATALIAVATAIMVSMSLDSLLSRDSLVIKCLTKIGDYSYSIYLVHFPVIVLVNYESFGGTKLGYSSTMSLIVMIAITVILSYLMYNYVEKLRSSTRPHKWLLIGFVSTSCLALTVPILNGSKYTEEQKLIFAAWEDRAEYRCGKLARITNPTDSLCQIGKGNSDKSVLLLGNSHADSIKVSFLEQMADKDISTYFYVSNNPLMSKEASAARVARDVNRIGIEAVVMHYSPSFYNNAFNVKQMSLLLNILSSKEVTVLFISPVPTYEHHVPRVLYDKTLGVNGALMSITAEEYLEKNNSFFSTMEDLGVSEDAIFHSHRFLCEKGGCELQDSGKPLYFDAGHLTLTGANFLAPLFIKIAQRLESLGE
jgi:peptidoglycan/LPS O-acetylase OafA/YrhL